MAISLAAVSLLYSWPTSSFRVSNDKNSNPKSSIRLRNLSARTSKSVIISPGLKLSKAKTEARLMPLPANSIYQPNTAILAHVCTFTILYRVTPPVNRGNVYLLAPHFRLPVRLLDRELSPVLRFFCTRLHLLEDACLPSLPPSATRARSTK